MREANKRDVKVIVPLVILVVFLILVALLRALAAPILLIGTVLVSFFAALGFGVLLDTFLVRSVLVPALTLDIGPKIWWPSSLADEKPSGEVSAPGG